MKIDGVLAENVHVDFEEIFFLGNYSEGLKVIDRVELSVAEPAAGAAALAVGLRVRTRSCML